MPLGDDVEVRSLAINPEEAKTVRRLFSLYLEHGSVRTVHTEVTRLELRTKRRQSASPRLTGGKAFSRGHIYRILKNPPLCRSHCPSR